jgi:hypothetical protein
MDIYLVNSGPSDFYQPKKPIRNALYKNNRDGAFTDVTEAAGVPGGTFGMGVAAGDYDNDGFPDLFVTTIGDFNNDGRIDVLVGNNGGPPLLLRNNSGQGKSLAGSEIARHEVQSGRGGRAPDVVRRRREAHAPEEQRWQLSVLARHA